MARLVSLQDATGVCASGLALGGLIVTTHPVEGRLLAALPGAEPCEALVVATAPVATDAFAPLAARGWRCQLRITVLRVEGPTKAAAGAVRPSSSAFITQISRSTLKSTHGKKSVYTTCPILQ